MTISLAPNVTDVAPQAHGVAGDLDADGARELYSGSPSTITPRRGRVSRVAGGGIVAITPPRCDVIPDATGAPRVGRRAAETTR